MEKKLPLLYVNLGKCQQNRGQEEKAMEYYNMALAAGEKTGNEDDVGYTFNKMGALYRGQKNWRKALGFHRRALAKYDSLGNNYAGTHYIGHLPTTSV